MSNANIPEELYKEIIKCEGKTFGDKLRNWHPQPKSMSEWREELTNDFIKLIGKINKMHQEANRQELIARAEMDRQEIEEIKLKLKKSGLAHAIDYKETTDYKNLKPEMKKEIDLIIQNIWDERVRR